MNVYERKGYATRNDYLAALAEDYDVPLSKVRLLADFLGPNEDFDGLVVHVEELTDLEA